MRSVVIGITLGLLVAMASPTAAQQFSTARELRVSFNADGTVNLAARNVSAREILAEWARQCQCHVVNAERLTGGAIMLPLQFENARQGDVLQSLLRSAAGYVLTPRRAGVQSASNYETIYILATSNPVAGAYVPPPATAAGFLPTAGAPDDELPPVVPIQRQTAVPPGQGPPQPAAPASSNPFGSRTTSPFVSITPVPGGQTAAPGTVAPGGTTTGPPGNVAPAPGRGPSGPPPPGTVVPIVPVAPQGP